VLKMQKPPVVDTGGFVLHIAVNENCAFSAAGGPGVGYRISAVVAGLPGAVRYGVAEGK
jgi:hypothetical protein